MDLFQTIIIAIIEGLTEFLPVSSTGHMIITQHLLGVEQGNPFVHAFTFIIQFGAILSVVCLYWKKFFSFKPEMWKLYGLLIIGVLPVVVVGLVAKRSGLLDWLLDSIWVVAITLVVGGIFMLFCDNIFNKGKEENRVTPKRAFLIGLFQCLSVIPGMSRSMSTIVGGMANKLTRKNAAEFSFFLAVPTMAGATILDVHDMMNENVDWATSNNLLLLGFGFVLYFVVSIFSIFWFVNVLTLYGFKAFGWYRIIVGIILLVMLLSGVSLNMVD